MIQGRSFCAAVLVLAAALGLGGVADLAAAQPARALPSSPRAVAAQARVRPVLERDLAAAGLRYGAPMLVRIFKRERELEVWLDDGRRYRLFRSYPICAFSGNLGPKQRTGDAQAPEGIYRVGPGQLNPSSSYHLSFNLGYPNAYDRAHGRSGSHLMVHGNCVSIGCYAMGDGAIEEIYSLLEAALRGGQDAVQVHALPLRLDASDAGRYLHDPRWGDFWTQLKTIDDAFMRTGRVPRVDVREGRYRTG